jgi:hypothetical protein
MARVGTGSDGAAVWNHVGPPEPLPDADLLLVESRYGDRLYPQELEGGTIRTMDPELGCVEAVTPRSEK